MPIIYSIVESNIPNISGMVARVVRGNRISPEELANSLAQKVGISKFIVQTVLNGLENEIATILSRGDNPDIGLGVFSLSLGGTFELPMTVVTPANADLRVSMTVSPQLRDQVKANATFQRVSATARIPSIDAIYDVNLANRGVFTPGGVIQIIGDNLEFNAFTGNEGVFFISGENSFRIANYGRKGTKTIELVAPREAFVANQVKSISPTGIQVKVRSTYGTQTLREGSYAQPLYRATFGGTVLLTDYTGVTGDALIWATRDNEGGLSLTYQEHGESAKGTPVAVNSAGEASYELSGSGQGNSLTVTVKGPAFYQFVEQLGILGELNYPVDVDIF